jgi:2-aminoadipate transaminase
VARFKPGMPMVRSLSQYLREEGMITSELEKTLRISPKFIYILPNFQNPTGVTLSFERRLQLIELSEK